jgi:hypothetical protein
MNGPVVVAGAAGTDNLGDRIILDCAAYLTRQVAGEVRILDFEHSSHPAGGIFWRACRRGARLGLGWWPGLQAAILAAVTRRLYRRDYAQALLGAARVVSAGGAQIRFKADGYDLKLAVLLEVCAGLGVPVMLNSVGVEGGRSKLPRATALRRALRNGAVTVATTRDDLDTLSDWYLGGLDVATGLVPDVAWWTDEAYGVSHIAGGPIGLGPVRPGLLSEPGEPISGEAQVRFWTGLAETLIARGQAVEFFTNGPKRDRAFVDALVRQNRGLASVPVRHPQDQASLVRLLASYDRIVSGRLHACVPAWSLGLPAFGVAWNDKVVSFFAAIGHPERAIPAAAVANPDIDGLVDGLLAAGVTVSERRDMRLRRESTRRWLQAFLAGGRIPEEVLA